MSKRTEALLLVLAWLALLVFLSPTVAPHRWIAYCLISAASGFVVFRRSERAR